MIHWQFNELVAAYIEVEVEVFVMIIKMNSKVSIRKNELVFIFWN